MILLDISQLEFMHPKLRAMVLDVTEKTGITLTATSLFRMNDTGTHGTLPLRADDFRMRHEGIGLAFVRMINDRWIYDHKRPEKQCAKFHNSGQGWHLHLQVHDNTALR